MKELFSARQRFSIRKFSFGVASIFLGTVFFAQNQAEAHVQTTPSSVETSNNILGNTNKPSGEKENNKENKIQNITIDQTESKQVEQPVSVEKNASEDSTEKNTNNELVSSKLSDKNNLGTVSRKEEKSELDSAYKTATKQEITNAAEAKKSAIDGQANLTSEEKAAAKKAVDTEAEKAKAAIDKATDQAGVDSAKAAGKQAIENVPTTGISKDTAKQEITDVATAKKAAIDANEGLTEEEKQIAKNTVDTAVRKAKENIDNAVDTAAIDTAKNDAMIVIENVSLRKNKESRSTRRGKRSIEDRSAEPPKHPKQVTNGNSLYQINAKAVPDNIYNQPMELFKYLGDAYYNWLDINSKPGIFKKYYDEIDEKNKVKRVVGGTGRFSDQLYRDEYKGNNQTFDIFHDYPTAARVAFRFDVNTGGAKLRVIDGNNNEIAVINVPKDHLFIKQSDWNREEAERQKLEVDRTAAKKAITNAANTKKSAIDGQAGLTAEEKQTAKNAVDAAATQAHQNIDSAIDKPGIENAKNNGLSAIQNVPVNGTAKAAAKQEITAAANAKKSAIDGQAGLTAEEKQTAKNAVDAAATQANRNIDSATNQAGVDTAKNNGKQAINAVPVNGTAKAAAKQEITAAANAKKSAIDGNTALTAEEKQTAKNAVDAAATQANRNIDSATNQAGVDTAKNNGKQAINVVPVNGTAKAAAKQEITNAADAKKSAIDANPALTKEEKEAAKAAVDTEAEKAKAAIDKATDQAGVDSAKAAGKQAIENVPTTATSKDAAKQEITNAADAKKSAIDTNPALTKEVSKKFYASKEKSKDSKNTLPNTGVTETNTGLAVLGILGGLLAVARRRKEK